MSGLDHKVILLSLAKFKDFQVESDMAVTLSTLIYFDNNQLALHLNCYSPHVPFLPSTVSRYLSGVSNSK